MIQRAGWVGVIALASQAWLASPPALLAQATARIRGVVVEQGSGSVVARGTVVVEKREGLVEIGPDGRFEVGPLPKGTYRLTVRALGYDSATVEVTLAAGETKDVLLALLPVPTVLPPLDVTEEGRRPVGRLAAAEQRMRSGRGQFLTQADIRQRMAPHLGNLLGTMRGVRSVCNGMECFVRMARAPKNCPPMYYLDGIPSDWSAVNTPLNDIYLVEVYRGPGETPGEYMGSKSGCGVIVIWTTAGNVPPPSGQ